MPIAERLVQVGGTSYEMGFQHGAACRDLIEYAARSALLKEINRRNTYTVDQAIERALSFMEFGREYAPHLDQELHGIAEGAGVSYEEVCMLQVRSELAYPAKLSAIDGCSSVAVQAAHPNAQATLVGTNLDMGAGLEQLGIVLHLNPKEGERILTWTLAGVVGQTGLNSAGLVRCGNVLFCAGWRVGVPTSFLFRRILEQETLEAASNLCTETHRAKSNNIMLAHAEDQILDIELTVTDHRFIRPLHHALCHTNHYTSEEFEELDLFPEQEDSRTRLARLEEFISVEQNLNEISLEQLMSDHANAPSSVCKHVTDERKRSKTIASCIMTPAMGRMRVAMGNPCEAGFETLYV